MSLKQQKGTEKRKGWATVQREEGEDGRLVCGWYLRQSSTFFVICSQCGRKASHLLYYHQAMIRMALATLLSQRQADASRPCMRVCVCVCPSMYLKPCHEDSKNTKGCLILLFYIEITVFLILILLRLWDTGFGSPQYNGTQRHCGIQTTLKFTEWKFLSPNIFAWFFRINNQRSVCTHA